MAGYSSGKEGFRAKTTVYSTDCHNLMRIFMYKKAYGTKYNNKKTVKQTKKKHSVILIGGSHARDYTSILQSKLKNHIW